MKFFTPRPVDEPRVLQLAEPQVLTTTDTTELTLRLADLEDKVDYLMGRIADG